MAKIASNHDCKQQTNVSEQEMLAQGELLGKAMQGMLKDAFAEAVVNAALGDSKESDLNQNIHNKLQALLTGKLNQAQDDEQAQSQAPAQALEQANGQALADATAPSAAQLASKANAQPLVQDAAQTDAHAAALAAAHAKADAQAAAHERAASEEQSAQVKELKKHLPNLELYTQTQLKAVREHIEQCFGPIYLQVEDSQTDHIRCDIDIVKPSDKHESSCQYLVTKGMGAHKMPVPDEFKSFNLERAELYLALTSDWNIESEQEQDSWPITLLSVLSRLPFVYDSWMAQGHIISFPKDEDYAPGTSFAGAILLNPDKDCSYGLELENLGNINFYQVVLLYQEEIDYAERYSARTLMKLMDKSAYVCCKDRALTKLRKPKNKPVL